MHQADKAELAWIRELSSPTIGEVTHPGFPAYLRVPHPAQDSDYQPVTWAHIAAGNGRELQALDTYADVAPEESSAWLDLAAPMQGELEENLLARLTALLSAHTSTPGRCTFLFHGSWFNQPVPHGAAEITFWNASYIAVAGDPAELLSFPVSAELWWPADHSWVVATPLDNESSFIGCGLATARAILDDDGMEALPVSAADSFLGL